jgi:hypothetical protein
MKTNIKQSVSMITGLVSLAGVAAAEPRPIQYVELESNEVVEVRHSPLPGKAASLLPADGAWKLVWHDEFDGKEIDKTKWMCRESFWGEDFPAFAHDFKGVEMTGETMKLHLVREGDDFCSPHLQTGSLSYDIPKDTKGFWPFGKRRPPLFMKKYGYFEIRCRLNKHPGWHSAFWIQSPSIGAHPDHGAAGIETDIMETHSLYSEGRMVCGNLYGGYGRDYVPFDHFHWTMPPSGDGDWHVFGCEWAPDGYDFYCDGRKIGEQNWAVSHVEEFVLVSTEPRGYRAKRARKMDGGIPTAGMKESEWGLPDPGLFKVPLPDFFEVDYVRVYDRAQPQKPLPELPVKKVDLPEGKAGDEMVMAVRRRVAKLCVMGVETCRREADDAEILRLHDILSAALDRALAAYKPGDNVKEKAFTHIKSSKISCEKIMRARQFTTNQ